MDFSIWNHIIPSKGNVLLAEPFMPDPNFSHAVILLCENNEEGAYGFILNKPTDVFLSDSLPGFEGIEARLYLGGPVEQNTLHFIHRVGDKLSGSTKIGEDIYWGGDFEEFKTLLSTGIINIEDFKFFLGYSGWEKDQLINELYHNSWAVSDIKSKDIFDDNYNNLWKTTITKLGGKYKIIANFPEDPRMN